MLFLKQETPHLIFVAKIARKKSYLFDSFFYKFVGILTGKSPWGGVLVPGAEYKSLGRSTSPWE